ncbi:TPA: DNA-binding protein [bacterium]|nr:DNA-binding protein [bacterium]
MQSKQLTPNSWIIRIVRGEKVIETLKQFCTEHKINGGFFYGLGACDQAELAHYNVETKKYSSMVFNQPLELIHMTGSIGLADTLIIHAHVVLSDTKMQTLGGHLVEARVSGTAEIYLTTTETLPKKLDPETGLKLFDLS